MASKLTLSGKDLQKAIIDLAHAKGWLVAHFQSVKTEQRGWVTPVSADGKGYPDLTLVRDRVVFMEIKGDGDRLRPDQDKWIAALQDAGAEVVVIHQKDWRNGLVDLILA